MSHFEGSQGPLRKSQGPGPVPGTPQGAAVMLCHAAFCHCSSLSQCPADLSLSPSPVAALWAGQASLGAWQPVWGRAPSCQGAVRCAMRPAQASQASQRGGAVAACSQACGGCQGERILDGLGLIDWAWLVDVFILPDCLLHLGTSTQNDSSNSQSVCSVFIPALKGARVAPAVLS